jgi:hypothetical protein
MRLIIGYQVSQVIHVAASLGIADLLKDGPRSSAEIAEGDRDACPLDVSLAARVGIGGRGGGAV